MQGPRWHIYPSVADLEARAAQAILRAGAQAIAVSGRFSVVLAGGTTPQRVYARLGQTVAAWEHWQIYFSDERCRPAGDPQRNDVMARAAWLDRVPIPAGQVHAIAAELGAAAAARRYAAELSGVDCFDLVLLGLGEDGHTASLFPGHVAEAPGDVIAVQDAPKPPSERVSLSARRLSRARQVWFVVFGAAKQQAIDAWWRGEALPAGAIAPPDGVDVLLDASAWPERGT